MSKCCVVRKIVVSGLLMGMVWTSGLWAQDAVLKMIPADCLFCVRINGLDQTLGQLDQFLMGISPMNMTMMAKMQLGQGLGNPMLAGVKTDGTFVVFAVAPAGEVKDPEVILNGLSVLFPISDYSQFLSSSPKIGKPDPNGVSKLEDKGVSVANLGNFALLGPSTGTFAATAKSLKAGAAKPLSSTLDLAEMTAATQSPLWVHGNIQVLARVLGPGIGDKIKQAGEKFSKTPAGAAQGMDMKGILAMYANWAETLLKEGKSVTVTVTPKPNVLIVSTAFAALPGTSMSDLLTKAPSVRKDWRFLNYMEDGAMMTMAASIDPGSLTKYGQKWLDMVPAMAGKQGPDEQVKQMRAMTEDMAKAVGSEMAMSMFVDGQAKPFMSGKIVFEVKDKDRYSRIIDRATELLNGRGQFTDFYANLGMKLNMAVKRAGETYQGIPIDSMKYSITVTDPCSPQAMMIQKIYGDGIEYRWAVVDGRVAAAALGSNSQANVRKLMDQVKAGGPKEMASEIKAALDLVPDAKNADVIMTLNYLRMFSALLPALMPMPMPQVNFQTKSNLVLTASVDKGKGTVQVALPKEHLTEIMQAVQQMMMQQMQQQQQKAGATGKS